MQVLSTAQIENQIANYSLHFDAVKDAQVEWKIRAPHFIPPFIEQIETLGRVPSQSEYVNHYTQRQRAELQSIFARWNAAERDNKYRALIARLERAYPSFVRDLYFRALLRENGIAAEYDPRQDVEEGVDLRVTHNGRVAQIHVYLDTPRARRGRAKKETRHTFSGNHIDLTLKREECKRVGKFWLPTRAHVEQIKRALEEEEKQQTSPQSMP